MKIDRIPGVPTYNVEEAQVQAQKVKATLTKSKRIKLKLAKTTLATWRKLGVGPDWWDEGSNIFMYPREGFDEGVRSVPNPLPKLESNEPKNLIQAQRMREKVQPKGIATVKFNAIIGKTIDEWRTSWTTTRLFRWGKSRPVRYGQTVLPYDQALKMLEDRYRDMVWKHVTGTPQEGVVRMIEPHRFTSSNLIFGFKDA